MALTSVLDSSLHIELPNFVHLGVMPALKHENEWALQYEKTRKIFKEVNETFPSSFVDKCWIGGSGIEYWIGNQRYPENGTWYHLYDPLVDMSDFDLKVSFESHNCVANIGGKPNPRVCTFAWPCGMCEVSKTKILYLKGLCIADLEFYDTDFYIYGLKNNRPYFR